DDQGRRKQACATEQLPSDARLSCTIEAVLVLAIDMVEKCPDLIDERQAGKLVHGCNEKRWQSPVNGLVNSQNWQRPARAKGATRVRATNLHVLGREITGCAAEAIARKGLPAPRARFDGGWGLTAVAL